MPIPTGRTVGSNEAAAALAKGEFVLLFDSPSREGETDMVIASQCVGARDVRTMRDKAGGLICTSVHPRAVKRLGLPFASELLESAEGRWEVLGFLKADDLRYDSRSSFSITVSHRDTFTGIPDRDRALTISALAHFLAQAESLEPREARMEFGRRFRSPGHVPLLAAAEGLMAARRGHTELATALVRSAGLVPSATMCEMLSPGGGPLGRDDAERFAGENGLVFVEGGDVISDWVSHSGEVRQSAD